MNDLLSLFAWTIQSSLLILIAYFAALCLRSFPNARRLVWVLTTCSILVLPLVPYLVPKQTPIEVPAIFIESAPSWPILTWKIGVALSLANALRALTALFIVHRNSRFWKEVEGCSIRIAQPGMIPCAVTYGLAPGCILLPSTVESWTTERLNIVVQHELAHVKKSDWLFHCASTLLCAFQWVNPLVWFAASRLRSESEAAADQQVINLGTQPTLYANILLLTARDQCRTAPGLGTVPLLRQGQLERRVRAILFATPAKICSNLPKYFTAGALLLTVVAGTFSISHPSQDYRAGFRLGRDYSRSREGPSLAKASSREKFDIERRLSSL